MKLRDLGKGFNVYDKIKTSPGLAAMKERMQLVGGDCTIVSIMGEGTSVTIDLPV